MIITSLSRQKKYPSRVNVVVDGNFVGVVFDEIVFNLGLKAGEEIDESVLNTALSDSAKFFAKNDAFKYLSKYVKTEKEVKEYLYKKGYHKDEVEFALNFVKDYGLISDEKYAVNYVKTYEKTKSSAQLKILLKGKGIADEIIDNVVVFDEENEIELAEKLVKKLYKGQDDTITYKDLAKLKRQLLSRGITYDTISKVTSKFVVTDIYGEN